MSQLSFPDEARARAGDRETSHEAAREVSERLSAYQEMVLTAIGHAFGDEVFTDVELVSAYKRLWNEQRGLGLMLQSDSGLRTRRHELTRAGLIREAGTTKIGSRSHTLWRRV